MVQVTRFDVADCVFPTDNEWGIPLLDATLQGQELVLPLARWGDRSRKARMPGTFHFYVDDYKFSALWKNPAPVVASGCAAVFEPSFSTNEQMPRAVGLWRIYMKRWLSRFWQQHGVRVFVDLSVDPKFDDLNLLGVPAGWRAYCTQGRSSELDLVGHHWEIACQHARDSRPILIVYGGGQEVEALCREQGLIWIPEHMHTVNGRRQKRG